MAGEFAGVSPEIKSVVKAPELPELALLPDGADTPIDQNEATYLYAPHQKIDRFYKADGSKMFLPQTFKDGEWATGAGEELWPLWREAEAYNATGKWVLMAEGEKTVESLRRRGFIALSPRGSAKPEEIEQSLENLKACGVAGICYWPDNDEPGQKKAEKIKTSCQRVGMPNIALNPDDFEGMPDKGDAADIADWPQLRFVNVLTVAVNRAHHGNNVKPTAHQKGFQSPKQTPKSEIKEIVNACRRILLNEDLSEVDKEIAISEIADESGIKEYRLEKFLKPLRRELRKTRFDLEIKALLLYDSAYEQYKAMMDMAVNYSVSVNTIRVCMERMKAAMRTPNVQAVPLSDRILKSVNEPKEWWRYRGNNRLFWDLISNQARAVFCISIQTRMHPI